MSSFILHCELVFSTQIPKLWKTQSWMESVIVFYWRLCWIHNYLTGGTVAKLCGNNMRRCRVSSCISFNDVCKEYECLIFICFPHQYIFFPFQQDPLCVAMNYSQQNILQTQGLPSYVLNILFQRGNTNKLSDLGWREQRFVLIMTVL